MSPSEELYYQQLVARARRAREHSRQLTGRSTELRGWSALDLGRTLTQITRDTDRQRTLDDVRLERLKRLSDLVGRDLAIEEAKLALRQRYDITGAQAFELLRRLSQTKNRKLRDVAKQVLAEPRPVAEAVGQATSRPANGVAPGR